jgi:hypothetical protein
MPDFATDQQQSADPAIGPSSDPAPAPAPQPAAGDQPAAAPSLWDRVTQTASDIGRGIEQEGVSGLLDPQGMMDRQQAQRDLADKFQVMPDDFIGPRLPNQVSEAEYEHIAHTYSDVRLGRGDLTIDPSALTDPKAQDAYRQGALNDIASMMQTTNGRAEIEQLHDNAPQSYDPFGIIPKHMHTTLTPLLQAGTQNVNPTNGYADPVNQPAMTTQADGTAGAGTDVNIRYNPGVNVMPAPGLSDNYLPFRSDVLLAHEMNHAVHETAGTMDGSSVQAADGVRDDAGFKRWEHQAVGLGLYANDPMTENAYRAERAQLGAAGAVGTRAGDAGMVQRGSYAVHLPAAPAPGGGGGGGGSPRAVDPESFNGGGND